MWNVDASTSDSSESSPSCQQARRTLIDLGIGEEQRRQLAEGLAHLESCEACRKAFVDFDQLQLAAMEALDDGVPAAPSGGWEALEMRLNAALPQPTKARWGGAGRWLRPLAALAAGVLLAVGGFQWGRHRDPRLAQSLPAPVTPATALLTAGDVARQVKAFGEIDQLFEGRTRWLLLTSGGADMAVDEGTRGVPSATKPADGKIVLLRLNVSREGEMVSTADLLIVAGKTAEVRLPLKDGTLLRYRLETSGIDPSQLALRAELRASGLHEPQAALATDLQLQPDRGTSAGQLIAPSGRYDVKVMFAAASI